MNYITKILDVQSVTHDVKQFCLEKPPGYEFIPGQATSVSINRENLISETRPFTFTSLNSVPYLEFIIKEYPEHHGITEKIHQLQVGDELVIEDPWGTISYADQGVFIAGGAGITPFMAILRQLNKDGKIASNRLFFSNKTTQDIIKENELREILPPENLVLSLTREEQPGYHTGRMDQAFIKEHLADFDQNFYVCGPKGMNADIKQILIDLGASSQSLIFEK
jgi:ferredoxin-NADP reductase